MRFEVYQNMSPLYNIGGWTIPDPDWVYTDKAGHIHSFKGEELATLDYVPTVTQEYWCDDCNDVHDRDVQPDYYKCKQCGEIVEPKYKISHAPKMIPGPAEYYINGEPVFKSIFDQKIKDEYIVNGNVYIETKYE